MWIVDFDGPPSWYLDASEIGESVREEGRWRARRAETLLTPPPLAKGIFYFPQFRSHQETKMAARRNQQLTSTISRKNRGL